MWSRFPLFYFDLRLSSHSVIHIDRSRLREQTRALVGLSQSSIGQRRSNTIHMFYRWGCEGGGKRNQASKPPKTPPLIPQSSDPVPGVQAQPSFDRECLTVVVNVLGVQLKCALGGSKALGMRMTCVLLRGRSNSSAEFWGPSG